MVDSEDRSTVMERPSSHAYLRPEVEDEKSLFARRWRSASRGVRLRRGECAICLDGGALSDHLLRRTRRRVDQPFEPEDEYNDIRPLQGRHRRWRLQWSVFQ